MKNVNAYEVNSCIRKTFESFQNDIKTATNDEIEAIVYCDSICFITTDTGDAVANHAIYNMLCTYYDVTNIGNIHICDDYVWICMNEHNLNYILDEVHQALTLYPEDSIDVIFDESTQQLCIMYHSDNNSFPIADNLGTKDSVNLDEMEQALDKLHVRHCW